MGYTEILRGVARGLPRALSFLVVGDCERQPMPQTSTRFSEADKRMQDAICQLSEIATAAAAQKEHEAKMLSVTAGSVGAVREVLQAEAKRARLFGWCAGVAGTMATAAAVGLAVFIANGARDAEDKYKRRLIEQQGRYESLVADADAQRTLSHTLRDELQQNRQVLPTVLTEMAASREELAKATSELTAARSSQKLLTEMMRLDRERAKLAEQMRARRPPAPRQPASNDPSHAAKPRTTNPAIPANEVIVVQQTLAANAPLVLHGSHTHKNRRAIRIVQHKPAGAGLAEDFAVYLNRTGQCTFAATGASSRGAEGIAAVASRY